MANKLYNFSCEVAVGRLISCTDGLGGIQKVFLQTYNPSLLSQFEFNTGAEQYELMKLKDGTVAVKQFDLRPNTASYNATITTSDENGTMFYEQVLEVVFNKIQRKDMSYMNNLAQGRCQAWILDAMDNVFLMGARFGCTVTGGAYSTGLQKADRNGFTLTFTGQEQINYMCKATAGIGVDGAVTENFPFDGVTEDGGTWDISVGTYPTT